MLISKAYNQLYSTTQKTSTLRYRRLLTTCTVLRGYMYICICVKEKKKIIYIACS